MCTSYQICFLNFIIRDIQKMSFLSLLLEFFSIPVVQSKLTSLRQFSQLTNDCFHILNYDLSLIVAIPGLPSLMYEASRSFCERGSPCPRLHEVIAIFIFEYFIHCNGVALLKSLLRSAVGMV